MIGPTLMAMSEACPLARLLGWCSMMLPLGREYLLPLLPLSTQASMMQSQVVSSRQTTWTWTHHGMRMHGCGPHQASSMAAEP